MKKVLFATTAAAALAVGGMASAQGITLFGDARLGLLYDEGRDTNTVRTTSRVRFGVNMTGETDHGITFGATVRADNAVGGAAGIAGNAFVSGDWGTVTMGDTSGADENWVGDVPGNFSLTGLGDLNETPFLSNGGGFGSDRLDFANNPLARPTVRYDFDIAGFGISLSSNHFLNDVAVGAGYSGDFGQGGFSIGVGYNKFSDFNTVLGGETATVGRVDSDGNPIINPGTGLQETITVVGIEGSGSIPSGDQWSVGMNGDWENFGLGIIATSANADKLRLDTWHLGGSFGWDAFTVGAYYSNVLRNRDIDGNKGALDGADSYGLTAEYDLGGGAKVAGGIVENYSDNIVADFGIKMSF